MAFTKPDFSMLDTVDTISEFTPGFGRSPNAGIGGQFIADTAAYDASTVGSEPLYAGSVTITGDTTHGDGNRMFPGVVNYAQARLDGGTGVEDTFFSTIAGYAIQNLNGDGDGIGVHGRARKTSIAGNVGDAAGVLGDVYQLSTELGGTMALEGRVYQAVAGNLSTDVYASGKWSTGLHIISDSGGSPATAGIILGGASEVGRYNVWRGLYIARTAFAQNGAGNGVAGTVGIDMGDWNSSFHAETAIKFGYADGATGGTYHLSRANSAIHVNANQIKLNNPSGGAGFQAVANGSSNPYLDLLDGSTAHLNLFWDRAGTIVTFSANQDEDILFKRNGSDRMQIKVNTINISSLPTSSAGLVAGDLWNNSGVLTVA